MAYPNGVHARIEVDAADGTTHPLELAVGPSESLGDLHGVVERFAEAYCLGIGAEAFEVTAIQLCLFDPERLLVAFDEDDDGRPSAERAMAKRFAFAFISQLEDRYSPHDPWLVVRPCTRDQVAIWRGLMGLDERYEVRTWCLDEKLTDRFQKT